MPSLKAIHMDLSEVWGFIKALDPDSSDGVTGEVGESEVPTMLPFPALSRLYLTRVSFDPNDSSNPDHASLDDLTTALVKRRGTKPMRTLRIEECSHIFRKNYKRIQKALPGLKVKWDRNESTMDWDDLEDL